MFIQVTGQSDALTIELLEYIVTPQSSALALPLELMIQRKARATKLPELPSSIGTHNTHNVHEQMIRKQGNRPEAEYSVLDPATPVYVQDSRGA